MSESRCINCMKKMEAGIRCPHCGALQQADPNYPYAMRPNTILHGKYLIGRVLGQGGFGITYVGFDLALEMKVAVKEYFPQGLASRSGSSSQIIWNRTQVGTAQSEQSVQSFLKEARRMAKLDSLPAIVRVRDTFQENGTAYIVMDFVNGTDLKSGLKKNGIMTFENCVRFLEPLLDSLEKMHAKGLIHRDISPDNIMVQPDGKPCLLDLGAAKDLTRSGSQSTQMVMKQGFSPLEQCTSGGNIGPWTDVYALTATIYYCITGKLVPNVMDRAYNTNYTGGGAALDFTTISGQSLSPAVCSVLNAGLALRLEDRIQSIGELRTALKNAGRGIPYSGGTSGDGGGGSFGGTNGSGSSGSGGGNNGGSDGTGGSGGTNGGGKSKKKIGLIAVAAVAVIVVIGIAAASRGGSSGSTLSDSGNVLMADGNDYSDDDVHYVLGSSYEREDIYTITFVDEIESNSTAWDVSADGDGSVMAWVVTNGSGYDLYIGGDGGVDLASGYWLFEYYSNAEEINFNSCVYTGNVTDMTGMFYDCSSLESLDLSGFDTSNVTDMYGMFAACSSLESLDLSGFDTSNVTDMYGMFYQCSSLVNLDVSSFDTSNVTDMYCMFDECSSLTSLDVSSFDTSNVTDMYCMFYECSSLESLDLSGFDTSNVTDMYGMFAGCQSLTELNLDNFDTGNVTDMMGMFLGCSSLESLDLSSFDTGNVTSMKYMFYYCSSLTSLDCSNFVISSSTDTTDMFEGCSISAESAGLDASLIDQGVTESGNVLMAEDDSDSVLGSGFDREDVITVTFVDYVNDSNASWDVSAAGDGSVRAWMSLNESGTGYDLYIGGEGGVDLSSGKDLFEGYKNVTEINFNSCLYTGNAESMYGMFMNCYDLTDLDLGDFDTSNVTDMRWMFGWCKSLVNLDVSSFDTSAVTTMVGMFQSCNSLESLDLSNFDTSAAEGMSFMFADCESLTSLNVSSFDTSSVTYMNSMFRNCSSLTKLDLTGFELSSISSMDDMFSGAGITASEAGLTGSSDEDSEYILPDSSTTYLTKDDLEGLTAWECKLARNEIYARHGRKFDDEDLQAYFDSCSWYTGTIDPEDFDESVLNSYELKNLELIVEYEEEQGYR